MGYNYTVNHFDGPVNGGAFGAGSTVNNYWTEHTEVDTANVFAAVDPDDEDEEDGDDPEGGW